eukprot:5593328-Amphidinium_carterae.2
MHIKGTGRDMRPFTKALVRQWQPCLSARKSLKRFSEDEKKEHRAMMKSDRGRVKKKFSTSNGLRCPEHDDMAPNDSGLPAPTASRADFVEKWCNLGSWAICETCNTLEPRPLHPLHTSGATDGEVLQELPSLHLGARVSPFIKAGYLPLSRQGISLYPGRASPFIQA